VVGRRVLKDQSGRRVEHPFSRGASRELDLVVAHNIDPLYYYMKSEDGAFQFALFTNLQNTVSA
jgi:hypothetical protein